MTTLPKIDRRAWLALWAQKRRRARLAPPAPVLWAEYPGTLRWAWDLPDPYRWQIWLSWDDGASWNFNSEYWTTGSDRDFVPDGGSSLHYVVGVDADGNEVTGRSNAVRPDDAFAPPVLIAWDSYTVEWSWAGPDPAGWKLYFTDDDGVHWWYEADIGGDFRAVSVSNPYLPYLVVGVDANGVETTGRSNAIRTADFYPPVQLWDNLTSYWPMDESALSARADYAIAGWTMWEVDYGYNPPSVGSEMGIYGASADFSAGNGTSGLVAAEKTFSITSSFSLAGWVAWTNGGGASIMEMGAHVKLGVNTDIDGVEFGIRVDDGNSGYFETVYGSGVPNDGSWHHVVAVFDSSANQIKVWVDGIFSSSGTLSYPPMSLGISDIRLGCSVNGEMLAGKMDEWGVWDRALTQSDVDQLWNNGCGTPFYV